MHSLQKSLTGKFALILDCKETLFIANSLYLASQRQPARVRYGAGAYFAPNFYGDHAIHL